MVSKRPRHVLHGGSRTRFRGAELEPGKEHPGRQHRAVGLEPAPSMLVPCLGRSSAPGRPPAAAHPGGSQTSPGWTARSSRSPGCHQSCARGCRCLPAGCSSPGFGGRQKSRASVTLCGPETVQGLGRLSRGHRRWEGGRDQALSVLRMRKGLRGSMRPLGLPRPPLQVCCLLETDPSLSCQRGPSPGYRNPSWGPQSRPPTRPPRVLSGRIPPSMRVLPPVCTSDSTLSSGPLARCPRGLLEARPYLPGFTSLLALQAHSVPPRILPACSGAMSAPDTRLPCSSTHLTMVSSKTLGWLRPLRYLRPSYQSACERLGQQQLWLHRRQGLGTGSTARWVQRMAHLWGEAAFVGWPTAGEGDGAACGIQGSGHLGVP